MPNAHFYLESNCAFNALVMRSPEASKERGLNKMQKFILYLASLSFIRRGIEGEVILIPKWARV
ncbi:hypothetical protein [Nostoc sp.]